MLDSVKLAVADVFITNELATRPPKDTDYLKEKQALQDLASHMAVKPEEVLPRFVDLAMEMAGGVSAGLSLYEEHPAPGVFRWRYLRGVLSPFEDATTPRDFSPCGITLDQNAPVLSLHPERAYDWIAEANIVVPEVLLVPLYFSGKEPLGTLWIVSDKEGHFDSGHARAMTELATFVGIALRMVRTEQQLQRALTEQETLAQEMSHRVKNVFAMTDAMIRMTAQKGISPDAVALLSGRLHALASAHALARGGSDGEAGGDTSDLETLTKTILRPHEAVTGDSRFTIQGPAVRCGNHAINGLALVLHELATNAVKYGALSEPQGKVDISWRTEDGRLILKWVEHGGPRIEVPTGASGFGTKLVQNTVVRQLGGKLDNDWLPQGLAVTTSVPLGALAT